MLRHRQLRCWPVCANFRGYFGHISGGEAMDSRAAELTTLYQDYGPSVWRYATRSVGALDEADEVLQETFVVAARNFGDLDKARSQQAWLIGIARNVIRLRGRSRRRRREVGLFGDYPLPRAEAQDPRVEAMKQAIGELPDAHQEVLMLRLSHDLSYAEIAEALDIPIGTVRSRLHAAITSLREWADDEKAREMRQAGAGR
jgi:RNA polymerase sigma-70 factor (ECF subfamily)